jgi:probable phosphoglycerate mutase
VFLVRHGATTASREDRFSGATDVDLSDEGRTQARRLAERLAAESLSAVYASPMRRTRETAAILAAPHGFEAEPLDALREIDHGHWEGLNRAEVEAQFGNEYAQWEEDPFTFAPEGGETGLGVLARALPAIRSLVERHAGASLLIVSHKATIRLVTASLLGFNPRSYRDCLEQLPCSLNILDFHDPVRARLMLYNDVSHYAGYPGSPGPRLSKWWS